jgi:small subunit ribosomal protein S30e
MGKVHGSLARAGKVKGQTPKVEAATDKKSDPRGRAKKRMQYNRRYVNVVTGMGGRTLGPNSNADKMK